MVHRVVVDSIATTIDVAEATVDTAADGTTILTVVLPDMTTVSVALMDVVTTMALVVSIAMHPGVVMTVTAAEVTITAVAASITVGMVGVLAIQLPMAMRLQETPGTHTAEVETKTTVLTIGTPVDDCGPLIYSGAERSAK